MFHGRVLQRVPARQPAPRREIRSVTAPISEHDRWMELQRSIGNQAVVRLLQRQSTSDAHAGRSAALAATPKPEGPQFAAGDAPAIVNQVLRSPGQPLDAATRAYFDPRFGHDFSKVRIHADPQAAESARAVHARAYTVGRHIVLGDGGRPSAQTIAERQLVAHELTHVVQQSRGGPPAELTASSYHEQEARAAASAVAAGTPTVRIACSTGVGLARNEVDEPPVMTEEEIKAGIRVVQEELLVVKRAAVAEAEKALGEDVTWQTWQRVGRSPDRALRLPPDSELERNLSEVIRRGGEHATEASQLLDEIGVLEGRQSVLERARPGSRPRAWRPKPPPARPRVAPPAPPAQATHGETTTGPGKPTGVTASGGGKRGVKIASASAPKPTATPPAATTSTTAGVKPTAEIPTSGGSKPPAPAPPTTAAPKPGPSAEFAGGGGEGGPTVETEIPSTTRIGAVSNFLIEAGLPGPLDAMNLVVEGFSDLAQAVERLRYESRLLGFAEGFSAGLLRAPWDWVVENVRPKKIHSGIGEGVAGFGGAREPAAYVGVREGYTFANKLPVKARRALRTQGITAAASERTVQEIRVSGNKVLLYGSKYFSFDDVLWLAVALEKPITRIVKEITEAAEEQARRLKRQLEHEEDVRYSQYGVLNPKRALELYLKIKEVESLLAPQTLLRNLVEPHLSPPSPSSRRRFGSLD